MSTSSDEELILKERKLQKIRGLPLLEKFNKETVEEVLDFEPADGDVIIATYPKTGTTWMQYIVHQILTKGESFPNFNDLLYNIQPFLEMAGVAAVEKLTTKPRVYKHHFPYDLMKKNLKSKVIYVYRKPEDTVVSYFHFINESYEFELDGYIEDFLTGNISYGQYFDHIMSYVKHKDDGNILFVSYEKLLVNREEEILRVAKFLGEEHFSVLSQDKSVLKKIIEHTDFSYMKNNLVLEVPKDPADFGSDNTVMKKINFFRKGTKGDGKKTLKEDQMKRLTELAKQKLKGTEILSEWMND